MADEWRTTTFGGILSEPVRTGIYKPKEFHGRGMKIVNMGELFAHPRLHPLPMKRVELSGSEVARFGLVERDLLFARRSLVAEGAGKCCIVLAIEEPTTFESSIIRARPDCAKADSLFLYYFFNSPHGLHALDTIRRQVAVAGITGGDLAKLKITLPQLPEQRAIAHILGTLDDKIELNRRMSETLEAMARALFKSWFVDFDPVRAKAEGRDPGLPKPLADLFPARLVASELGEIPEGWEIGVLENALAEIEVGGRPKGGVAAYSQGVPSIGAESIVGLGIFDYSKTKFVPREYFEQMTKGHIKSRDVLLYKDGGRPGEFEPHVTLIGDGFPFETAANNEHVYRLRARPHVGQEFLFFWLSSDLVMEEMRIKGTGVAVPGLNSTQVKSLTTLLPSTAVVEAFAQYAEPCVARVLAACKESRTLTSLRDALLPKLISGELRLPAALRERAAQAGVKDAERIVGRCL